MCGCCVFQEQHFSGHIEADGGAWQQTDAGGGMTLRGTLQSVDMGKMHAIYTITIEQVGVTATDQHGNTNGPVGTQTVDARSGSFTMAYTSPDGLSLAFVYNKEP